MALEMLKFKQLQVTLKENIFTDKNNDILFSIILRFFLFLLPMITEFFHVHIYHIPNHLRRVKHRISDKKAVQKIKI